MRNSPFRGRNSCICVCNKPFRPIGVLSGRVWSREGLRKSKPTKPKKGEKWKEKKMRKRKKGKKRKESTHTHSHKSGLYPPNYELILATWTLTQVIQTLWPWQLLKPKEWQLHLNLSPHIHQSIKSLGALVLSVPMSKEFDEPWLKLLSLDSLFTDSWGQVFSVALSPQRVPPNSSCLKGSLSPQFFTFFVLFYDLFFFVFFFPNTNKFKFFCCFFNAKPSEQLSHGHLRI